MRALKTVGILGGMGPLSSAHFLRLLIREFNAAGIWLDGDFPRMIFLSLPLNDWGVEGASSKDSVATQVTNGVKWLAQEAEIIAIPCNTVHEFYGQYTSFGVPVLNIIDETLAQVTGEKVGVLCSRQTRDSKLYERPGKTTLYADDQDEMDMIIEGVMRGEIKNIGRFVSALRDKGAESVILGCTELSLCPHDTSYRMKDLSTIDSSESLARALVRHL